MREARALGKLSHPNVVQVHDVGEHGGDVFVAMELVDGEPLDVWSTAPPEPSAEQVLAAFRDAARGLSAAHEKGLIHRDVKPSNILRGKDGRVRVLDFGIAADRAQGDDDSLGSATLPRVIDWSDDALMGEAAAASSRETVDLASLDLTLPAPLSSGAGASSPRLTQEGAVVGTPLYLSPEQAEGRRASPASDQYSLCLALHESLYGALPFTEKMGCSLPAMLGNLLAQKRRGPPASPPAGRAVPGWVYRVIARGLAPDPEDRYPSMDALAAALSRDPSARWGVGGRAVGGALAGVALLVIAAAGWTRSLVHPDPCAHPERDLAGAWDASVKDRVRAAFAGTRRPYAEDTAGRVTALLDCYVEGWATMRGEVCEARRGERQGATLLAAREACLDWRRGQLQALTSLLAEKPDPVVLERAVQAAAGLYPVAYCADVEALTAPVQPPEDPAVRARVAELLPRVDRLEALVTAGRYKDGLVLGEPLLAEAVAVGHAPLRGQVQLWIGVLHTLEGEYEAAETALRDAAISAAEGRDEVLAVSAWSRLLVVVAESRKHFEEAAVIRKLGPTALARVRDDRAQATWLCAEGRALNAMSRGDDARIPLERALGLLEKTVGHDHPEVATVLNALGNAALGAGDFPGALDRYSSALAVRERVFGPDHPGTAALMGNLGLLHENIGDYPRARTLLERSLASFEKGLGPDHPNVGAELTNLGTVLFDTGALPEAKALYERAIAIHERTFGPDHPGLAEDRAGLARTEVRLGHLDAARPLLEKALASTERAAGAAPNELTLALLGMAEWHLADHHPELSVPLLERALAVGDPRLAADVEMVLADAVWALGKDSIPRPRARGFEPAVATSASAIDPSSMSRPAGSPTILPRFPSEPRLCPCLPLRRPAKKRPPRGLVRSTGAPSLEAHGARQTPPSATTPKSGPGTLAHTKICAFGDSPRTCARSIAASTGAPMPPSVKLSSARIPEDSPAPGRPGCGRD